MTTLQKKLIKITLLATCAYWFAQSELIKLVVYGLTLGGFT
jgi:hypothetical protein